MIAGSSKPISDILGVVELDVVRRCVSLSNTSSTTDLRADGSVVAPERVDLFATAVTFDDFVVRAVVVVVVALEDVLLLLLLFVDAVVFDNRCFESCVVVVPVVAVDVVAVVVVAADAATAAATAAAAARDLSAIAC